VLLWLKRLFVGSLRRQLAVGMALTVAATMSLFVSDMIHRQQSVMLEQQTKNATGLAQSVATSGAVWVASRDFSGLQQIVEGLSNYPDLRHAIVLDLSGQVLAHSDHSRHGLYLTDLPRDNKPAVLRTGPDLVDVVSPVMIAGNHIGWVRIGLGRSSVDAELARVARSGVYYALIAIALCTLLAFLAGHYLTRRLYAIQQVADAVQVGKSQMRAKVSGDDEAADLAIRFNGMLDSLSQRETALRESEGRFRHLFEGNSSVMLLIDPKSGKIVEANQAAASYYGHAGGQLIGMSMNEIGTLPPERIAEEMQHALREECNYFVSSHRLASGQARDVEMHSTQIESGGRSLLFCIVNDITERKRAEEATNEAHKRLLAVFNGLDAIVYVADMNTYELLFVNKFVKDAFGDVEGQPCWKAIQAGQTGPCAFCTNGRLLDAAGNPGEIYHWEFQNTTNGKWYDIHDRALRWVDGRIVRLEIATDISERKKAEEALQESAKRHRTILHTAMDGFWLTDAEGNLLEVNEAYCKMSGYTEQELLAMRIPELEAAEAAAQTAVHMQRIVAQGEDRFESRHRRKDGSIFDIEVSVQYRPVEGGRFIAFVQDITARKQQHETVKRLNSELEQRIQERTQELQRANRELESFSYSVSHDLRAPLRAIEGFSSLLEKEYSEKLDERARDYFKRVRGGATRMAALIDDLLNLSRITRQEMHRAQVDLTALVRDAAGVLQAAEPEHRVEWQIAPDVRAEGDSGLLRIALQNLIGNAWKYSSKREVARIEFGVTQWNGRQAFFVRDNGEGFDMAYADKLFGAFQRLHSAEEFPGSGIGLATVARIIHRHGGSVGAEGRVHEGATFYFTL